ncbi:hypothetical protein HPT25_02325 [Bacillus sp. BRMEA1]|uniref:beta-1,6-N-acetylglucosaminyltransferase n=1 Tax=Neobacillus endophyticus TaxID=2738405 RepID=UPI0015677470|nr:beta-1,6-N-acetylglucosaminyltransferase [Neobacillus endophyticus]NRD76322.1 hypothetical protein [Neobacillus endophyticus]
MKSPLKTAYILQIHKNPEQVNKFIHQLISQDHADVFIHIDKKNYEPLKGKLIKSPNVKILQNSINCNWGDISQVDTTILLMKEVLASRNKYDFVSLRSGQDLLVKNGLKEFLVKNHQKVFMDVRQINEKHLSVIKINWPKVTRKRYTTAHPFRIYRRMINDLFGKGINLFPNTNYWPNEYSFYCGSQWFTIPFEVVQYIVKFLDENQWYYKYFEKTFIPDEWFFQTIIMNSPFKSDVVNNNLLYLKMGEKLNERNSPLCLMSKDIGLIEETNHFFARKFDDSIDRSVIEYFTRKVSFSDNNGARKTDNILKV